MARDTFRLPPRRLIRTPTVARRQRGLIGPIRVARINSPRIRRPRQRAIGRRLIRRALLRRIRHHPRRYRARCRNRNRQWCRRRRVLNRRPLPPLRRIRPHQNTPAPADTTVAMTTPPATPAPAPVSPPAPAPRPVQPPPPPANLPPAEISRDGNQAVVALLESADKYVKSNQLDKAGAALERALRIEPRNAGIWHDLAQIRLHQGQYQQAESLASKSNNLAGGNRALQSRNWKLIGSARKAAGNAPGAEEAEAHASQLSN